MRRTVALVLLVSLTMGLAPVWAADRVAYRGAEGLVVREVHGAASTIIEEERGATAGLVWLATGRNWPDSLSAGPAVARAGGVLLLADGLDPAGGAATWSWLEQHRVSQAWLVGGPDVLTPAVRVALERRSAG